MDPLRTGAKFLSRGMRDGNSMVVFLGAALAAVGVIRWLDGPERRLVHSRRLEPGEGIRITVVDGDA